MIVNVFYVYFLYYYFCFSIFCFTGVFKFGPIVNVALGVFLIVWTILTISFGLFMFLEGALSNLVGLKTAFGGYAGLISTTIGFYLWAEGLIRMTVPVASVEFSTVEKNHTATVYQVKVE